MLNFNDLWLVRTNPENINRLKEFLENNIIAIGWSNLIDLTGMAKRMLLQSLLRIITPVLM